MLDKILATLKKRQSEPLSKENNVGVNDTVNDTVNLIKANPKITLDELALKLNKSRRTVTRIIKLRKIYATLNRLLHTLCLPDEKSGTKQSVDCMRIMKLHFLNLLTLP